MTTTRIIGPATLIHGDMLDVLPSLPRSSAVVCDPPYGIKMARRGTLGSENAAPVRDYGKADWDDEPIDERHLEAMRRHAPWQIIFGGNFFPLPPSPCWLVWDKHTTGDYADCELAWTNLPGAVRRISFLWNGMIRHGNDVRVHPTQKPVGVMRWCLGWLPTGCDVIADPFMGSGSTGVAAVLEGKRFVGIERDPAFFEIACERIAAAWAAKQNELPFEDEPVLVQRELFA